MRLSNGQLTWEPLLNIHLEERPVADLEFFLNKSVALLEQISEISGKHGDESHSLMAMIKSLYLEVHSEAQSVLIFI